MPPATSLRITTIVVVSIAIESTAGVLTLSWCLIAGVVPDPTLITAYVGITSGLVGALAGLLVNTRTPAADHPPEEPTEVIVTNTDEERIPVKDGVDSPA